MNLDRLRRERPEILLASDERELIAAMDEPPEPVREAFLDAIPSLLSIYTKKRKALEQRDENLWREVLADEADLVGMGM